MSDRLTKAIFAGVLLCLAGGACATWSASANVGLLEPGGSGRAPLKAGDRMAVKVWSDSTISDTFVVTTSGELALPKIGVLQAGALGAEALQDSVRRAYTALVTDPAVQVSALRRVGVVGEVRQPGIYFSDLSMTIGDLIALAGGITESGSLGRITINRDTQQIRMDLRNGDAPIGGIRSGDQVRVGMRSFWARNPGLLLSTITGLFYFAISRF
jgi:protein involved in polysaccharide export with SLBB domain